MFAKPAVHLLVVALVGLLAYANTFHAPFVFDDETSITRNPVIKDLARFLSGAGYGYNPRRVIGYLTIALNYRLGGLDVTGYHIFNLVVHVAAAWFVYALVRLTLQTPFFGTRDSGLGTRDSDFSPATSHQSPVVAFTPLLAALLFVVHPVQTQAVTYVIQRLASLATMFYLLSLVLYVKARLLTDTATRDSGPGTLKGVSRLPMSLLCYAGALLAAGLAMKTKEIAFTLPFVVVLYEFSFFRMTLRKKLLFLLPVALTVLIVPLSLVGTGRSIGQLISDVTEKTRVETAIPRLDYLYTQFRVVVTYIRLLFFPVNQNLDYDYPVYRSFLAPPVVLSFLLLLALFGLAVYLYYRSTFNVQRSMSSNSESRVPSPESRLIAFGILWFFITLSVESSLIPIADVIFEHRLYLPSAGAFTAAAALAAILFRNAAPRRVAVGAGIVVIILGASTFARNRLWNDPIALAKDIARKSPEKARPHYNLALALSQQGRLGEAFREAGIAIRLAPGEAKPHNLAGMLYAKGGKYDHAVAELSEAVRLAPEFADAHCNLGDAYSEQGRKEQALEQYFTSLRLDPGNPEIYNKIGMAYGETGQADKAIPFFQSAASLAPANAAYGFNLQRALQLAQSSH